MPVPDKIRHVVAVMNFNCPRVCRPNDNLNALATDLPDPVRHIPVTVFRSVFTINNYLGTGTVTGQSTDNCVQIRHDPEVSVSWLKVIRD